MNSDLEKARQLLAAGGFTCVLCKDDQIYTSSHRGVKPLLELVDSGKDLAGFSAADKVVGRATALLYCLLGAQAVWGGIMSSGALEVFSAHGITALCDKQVPCIQNRAGNGTCPMEAATAHISDPVPALTAIRNKLNELQG